VHRLFVLDGDPDPVALEHALHDVVRAHPALRTAVTDGGAVPAPVELAPQEAVVLARENPVARVDDLLTRARTWRVGLAGPTMRWTMAPCASATGATALAMVAHHAFVDGWSLRVLFRDLGVAYDARRRGRVPRLAAEQRSFARWAAAVDAADRGTSRAFWRAELRGVQEISWPGPAGVETGSIVRPVDVPAGLRRYARTQGVTVTTVLLDALARAVARVTKTDDVCVAVPTSGRDEPDVHATVGLFVNPVPVRIRGAEATGGSRLGATHAALLRAMGHARPFDEIVSVAQPPRTDRPTLCRVALLRHLHPDPEPQFAGLRVSRPEPPPSGAMYELMVEVWPRPGGGWSASLQARADAVSSDVVEAVHRALDDALGPARRP
jgi:hypothetical protein